MPYLKQDERVPYKLALQELQEHLRGKPIGHLTYLLFRLCAEYHSPVSLTYTVGNAVVGSLECVKMEYYRRLLALLENRKIEENGDVL